MISIKSRLHRTIRDFEQFEIDVSNSTLEKLNILPMLLIDEEVLGLYRNKTFDEFFLITDLALILSINSNLTRVNFSEMQSSNIVFDCKSKIDQIQIHLKNGDLINVRLDGSKGKFRDVFECGRFFARVIEDQDRKA